ncbi:GNAT family N-acetyltransferase [Qipengyuania sp. SS22]|uniref:GNAT family N-acetyltransferase n=1 Tax=Qipengyuania sp. SS22 TaxID=2979461 RepID=UPI0021E583C4|nr:GNAT family N-acetyltransferase [Qipengyuania sp. SS22]UYH55361.1 GNAT family N-acetyltransferase [Qipengyuania sp. SS22]
MTYIDDLTTRAWSDRARDHSADAVLTEGFSVLPWRKAVDPGFAEQWRRLATNCATPNPFAEEWFLAHSLRHFDPDGSILLACHVSDGELVGLMPLMRDRDYHGQPLPHLANWVHANAFCGEPLVKEGYARPFWKNLLDWCDGHAGTSVFLHLTHIPTDGATYAALQDISAATGRKLSVVQSVERAALRSGPTPQEHLRTALDRKRRKELQRKRRRLEESGQFVFSRQTDEAGLDQWIDEFLALERAGWKGEQGSAMASSPATEALFRASLTEAAQLGKLERLAFHLDGRPVAMLTSFVSPPHAFGFKTAYDESLSKLSPGMLLQVENLAILECKRVTLSDSCAAPNHPMIGQIWPDRREIAMLTIPIGGRLRRGIGAMLTAIELYRTRKRQ